MKEMAWWQKGVIYQVYPRSFQDTDGDGVGDLKGVRSGFRTSSIWGSMRFGSPPIFPSPMGDFGYDVRDYCDVDPLFGALSDFDALSPSAHARGIKDHLGLRAEPHIRSASLVP